ncbi:KxYKxGKxW signal peptide domain-containing protein [Streptococcus dentasini]
MEIKRRIKMHKVKKHWVAIATMVVMLTGLGAVRVSADQTTAPVSDSVPSSQTSNASPAEATETGFITDDKTAETVTAFEAKSQVQEDAKNTDSEGTQLASAEREQELDDKRAERGTESSTVDANTESAAVSDSSGSGVSEANSDTDMPKHQEGQNSSGTVSETHAFNQNARMDTENMVSATLTAASWHKGDTGKFYSDGNGQNLTGFQTIDGKLYYFQDDGQLVENQFFTPDHEVTWYCADETGQLLTGLKTFQGNTYFFRPDGSQVKGAYAEVDGNWYYLDKDNGQPLKFWQTIDGTLRFFDDETGIQAKNGIYTIEGRVLRFDDNGNPFTMDGQVYTLPSGLYTYKGKTYYRNEDGSRAKGFKTIDGKLYFFGDDYAQVTEGFRRIDYKLYHFGFYDHEGDILRGSYLNDGDKWYYFDKDTGQALTGWQTIDGTKRYFDSNGVQAKNIDKTIDGLLYHFDDNGNPSSNQNEEHPSITGHFEKSGNGYGHVFIDDKTGQKVSGVQYINGEEYHFSKIYYNNFLVKIGKDGKAYDYRGELLPPGLTLDDISANVDPILINDDHTLARNKLYWGSINYHPLRPHLGDIKTGYLYFDQEGYAIREKLVTVDGKTYYFGQDGFAITNSSQTIDGKTYYFNEDGNPIASQYKEIGGNWYYFDRETGQALTGWQTIDNTQRYFDKDGVQAKDGDYTIDGILYHFDADGNPSRIG